MLTELHLALRYLFRGKTRHISFISLVSCLGIGLGVATLIIVISVMNGFDRDLMDKFMRFNYHLTIEGPNSDKLTEAKQEISTWAGVKSTSIYLQTQVFAKLSNLVFPLVVKGIDFTDEQEEKTFSQYVKKDNGGEGFFVGEGLNRRFFIPGKLEFYPLAKKMQLQTEKVRGVFKVGLYDVDNNYIITDLEKAKSLSPNYLLFLGIRIDSPFKANQIKEKIIARYGNELLVSTWFETNRALFAALKLEKLTMFIILSLIILVAAFNIFATLTARVVEKTKDVGILKTLGFSSKRILWIFSFQGLILGFLGSVFGLVLGLGLCVLLEKYSFIRLPQEIYYIEYLPVAINYRDIALIAFLGIFLSFIFSLLPAKRAANLQPSEALRYE